MQFNEVSTVAFFVYGLTAVLIYILLPRYMQKISKKPKVVSKNLVLAASVVFFVSLLLPSPTIHGDNTEFITHLIGGGVFSGLIWLFIKNNLAINLSAFYELLSLYFLVSGLGVANELFEMAANEFGLINIDPVDVWWDLLANTLGALCFWVLYRLEKMLRAR